MTTGILLLGSFGRITIWLDSMIFDVFLSFHCKLICWLLCQRLLNDLWNRNRDVWFSKFVFGMFCITFWCLCERFHDYNILLRPTHEKSVPLSWFRCLFSTRDAWLEWFSKAVSNVILRSLLRQVLLVLLLCHCFKVLCICGSFKPRYESAKLATAIWGFRPVHIAAFAHCCMMRLI